MSDVRYWNISIVNEPANSSEFSVLAQGNKNWDKLDHTQ